ncbi:MAG: sugar phosphate isomerase/epimerase [Burkholderiales bacterium]|nr:MAG: sugar phosphate isomerase/epimerase [Burkholderiales bacterium]
MWNPKLALHTWTIDTTPLEQALAAIKSAGWDATELRRIDFERCYERGLSNAQVIEIIKNSGLAVCTLGVKYGWLFAKGEERKRLFTTFRESCENAVALDCKMVMSAPGPLEGDLKAAARALREAGDIAQGHGLQLAIEFNSQHANLNSVQTLGQLINDANHPACGYLLDAYHLHRSGRPGRGFDEVPDAKIFAFQYSDCAKVPVTGVKRPTDRLPPGQGVIDWQPLLQLLAEKKFSGYLSYESPNPLQWDRDPGVVAQEGLIATRSLLKQAGLSAFMH